MKKPFRCGKSDPCKNKGFSITELLVGAAAGLVVVGGGIAIAVSSLASGSTTVKTSRLNQDLMAMMSIMVNEIRRAGFGAYTGADSSIQVATGGKCIFYAYDGKEYGFKYDSTNKQLDMRKSDSDYEGCSDPDSNEWQYNWEAVNDESEVVITDFTITNNPQCLDSDGAVVACTDATAEIAVRQIGLSLTGQLTNDSTVLATLEETVRVRNDEPIN
jgi:type IV pilus assembly protein PilW